MKQDVIRAKNSDTLSSLRVFDRPTATSHMPDTSMPIAMAVMALICSLATSHVARSVIRGAVPRATG